MLTTMQEAWDSYIQNGSTLDPAFQFYQATDQSQLSHEEQQQQQQQQADASAFGNGVFMGAYTPGR
jgi:hypothetical protein